MAGEQEDAHARRLRPENDPRRAFGRPGSDALVPAAAATLESVLKV
jgi:hypothetical protein